MQPEASAYNPNKWPSPTKSPLIPHFQYLWAQGLKFRVTLNRVYFLDGRVVQEHAWLCENRGSKLHVSCLISHDLDMENSRSFISVLWFKKALWANEAIKDKTLSEMLKFTTHESYCFTLIEALIVFVLTRQETIKNNNTEQYLLFSNSGRFSWYEQNQDLSRRLTKFLVDHSLPHLLATFLVNCSFLCRTKRKICRYTCGTSDVGWGDMASHVKF